MLREYDTLGITPKALYSFYAGNPTCHETYPLFHAGAFSVSRLALLQTIYTMATKSTTITQRCCQPLNTWKNKHRPTCLAFPAVIFRNPMTKNLLHSPLALARLFALFSRYILITGQNIVILIRFCLLTFLMLTLPGFASAATIINSFRTTDEENSSRFVMDLSNNTSYTIFTLDTPHRLVIDIPNAQWQATSELYDETRRIKAVRHAPRDDGTLRVVLDVNQPVAVKNNFILNASGSTPHRLVIDIIPTNKALDDFSAPPPVTKEGTSVGIPLPVYKDRPKPLIVIDAGHGGHDPGAIGRKQTREKDITLAYARELRKALLETNRYRVYMTRDSDVYVQLQDRVQKAERQQGDLFISLHADSSENRKTHGLSVYTLSENASDREAAALARKENRSGVIGDIDIEDDGDDITALLIDLVQRDTKNISASFAEEIVAEMKKNITLVRNTHRFAGFRVLTGAKVPSVLVELGYLSNRSEEKLLKSDNYKKKLAKSLVAAIDSHFIKYRIND